MTFPPRDPRCASPTAPSCGATRRGFAKRQLVRHVPDRTSGCGPAVVHRRACAAVTRPGPHAKRHRHCDTPTPIGPPATGRADVVKVCPTNRGPVVAASASGGGLDQSPRRRLRAAAAATFSAGGRTPRDRRRAVHDSRVLRYSTSWVGRCPVFTGTRGLMSRRFLRA